MSAEAERWDRLALARPEDVSLAEGALLIAAEEYGDLDVDGYICGKPLSATLQARFCSERPGGCTVPIIYYLRDNDLPAANYPGAPRVQEATRASGAIIGMTVRPERGE